MIRHIKKKYIIIVMSSVIAVLGLIIAAINIANFSSINSLLEEKVAMLVDNEGLMPEVPFGEKLDKEEPEEPENTEDGEENSADEDNSADTEDSGDGSEDSGDGAEDDNGTSQPDSGDGSENGQGSAEPDTGDGDSVQGDEDQGADTDQSDDDQTDMPSDTGEDTDSATGDGGEDVKEDEKEEEKKEDEPYQYMSPETPFELRYFSVKLNTDGGVLAVDTSKIAAVDAVKAEKYAKEIFTEGKEKGFIDSYKYMIGSTEDGNLIYVFLDADRELKSFRAFLISSLVITALGILTVMTLVILLSGVALKPIIESYEKQKRFITDAGHEMKTPLTVISANAEIIEMENGDSQWVTGIKNQVSKLADLTEKLVILSKMEEGARLEMNDFSLSEAFFDTCDQYKSIALSKGVRFDLAIAEDVRVVGNENEIRRCITLVLDNAFRYVDENGYVSVKIQSLTNGAELRFSNSTNGVQKGSLDNWFDRFYRTDVSRNSDTGGSGIGLSVVKAIVLAHGGTVKAHSHDGVTVEFTINI